MIDLSHNKLEGPIPATIGGLDGFKVAANSSAMISGAFTLIQTAYLTKQGFNLKYSYVLATTTYIGSSFNALTGNIPQEIAQLVALLNLDLSSNTIEGGIPYALGLNLTVLETLRLSQNNLANRDPIPSSLASISTLSFFNVSFNNLQGQIPVGHQFTTCTNKSYLPENPGLCGDVINRPCSSQVGSHPTNQKLSQSKFFGDAASWMGFWIGTLLGFC